MAFSNVSYFFSKDILPHWPPRIVTRRSTPFWSPVIISLRWSCSFWNAAPLVPSMRRVMSSFIFVAGHILESSSTFWVYCSRSCCAGSNCGTRFVNWVGTCVSVPPEDSDMAVGQTKLFPQLDLDLSSSVRNPLVRRLPLPMWLVHNQYPNTKDPRQKGGHTFSPSQQRSVRKSPISKDANEMPATAKEDKWLKRYSPPTSTLRWPQQ